jgi:hypothetical protein
MRELTFAELSAEHTELLPTRETLVFNNNWAAVYATNSSLALNAATFGSIANSFAGQSVNVIQG